MKKLILGVLSIVMLAGCSVVAPGHKGVRISQGVIQPGVLSEGYYLWVPFFRRVKSISVRVQKTETQSEAASKDMQRVSATLALNWHVDPSTVNSMFQTIGDENDAVAQIINPAVSEVLKSATAKMTAEEILTRRIELKNNIDATLTARLKVYNILVNDVSLVDLNFTKEFDHAVEAKQISEQETKQAEYVAQKATIDAKAVVNAARGEAQSALLKAEAEAKANELKQKTLTPQLIQYEAIQRWDGKVGMFSGGNGGGAIPFVNLPASLLTTTTTETPASAE